MLVDTQCSSNWKQAEMGLIQQEKFFVQVQADLKPAEPFLDIMS